MSVLAAPWLAGGTGVLSLILSEAEDGIHSVLSHGAESQTTSDSCKFKEASNQIARADAPHSAVAKLRRDMCVALEGGNVTKDAPAEGLQHSHSDAESHGQQPPAKGAEGHHQEKPLILGFGVSPKRDTPVLTASLLELSLFCPLVFLLVFS
ncbi:unnamed protein product [Effrenium voratum]|nr:unnamed protein product [Effrenium voratum]